MNVLLVVIILLFKGAYGDLSQPFVSSNEYPNNVSLLNGDYMLYWETFLSNNTIEIAIVVNGIGWAAFGIGHDPVSGMQNADAFFGYISSSGIPIINDVFIQYQGVPPQPDTQLIPPGTDNILIKQGGQRNGQTTLKILRFINITKGESPVDQWDKSFVINGTTPISYAFNPTSTFQNDYHGSNRGTANINFFATNGPQDLSPSPPLRFHLIITGGILFILLVFGVFFTWTPFKQTLFYDFIFYRKVGPMSNSIFLRLIQYNEIANLTIGELCILFAYFCCFGAWYAYGYLNGVALGLIAPVARGFAWANILNVSILLCPVNRYSIWLYIFGITYDRAIKFHRWIARWTLLIISVHGLLMIGYYQAMNDVSYVFQFNSSAPYYTLAGPIAWAFIFVVFLLTQEPIRRRFWEVFQYLHVPLGFIGFGFLIAHATVAKTLPYMAFSLLIYCSDIILRFGFGICQPAKLEAAEYIEKCGITKLTISKKWPFTFQPGQYVFIWIDKVSPFEWHPFSISSGTNALDKRGDTQFTLHIKNVSFEAKQQCRRSILKRWTEKLAIFALDYQQGAHIRVEGPYGRSLWENYETYETVVLFAGGIGVTPINCLYKSLVDLYLSDEKYAKRRVYVIWVIRTSDMLETMPELSQNQGIDSKMSAVSDVKIYITREGNSLNGPILFTGRPNFKNILKEICAKRKDELNSERLYISIAVCATSAMTRDVQSACWHMNDLNTRLHFQNLSFAI